MDRIIKRDALLILDKVIDILKIKEEKDVLEIKNLSNHTIHNASVFQDYCSVSLAVIIYALSKIIERKQFELNYSKIIRILNKARKALKNDEEHSFKLAITNLFSLISTIDSKLKLYVEEVINEAQIKKGSKLCEHGLSCAKASQLLGISQWELMSYLGHTELSEDTGTVIDIRKRINFARGLFT